MSFRDVDLATIEVLSAALVRGGPWTHNIGAGVDGVLMGLVNHGWSGPAATAMIRRWKLQKPAQEATSSAMTAAGQALGDHAVGISSLQRQFAAVISQAAAVGRQCQADGVTSLPYGYEPLTDTRALPRAMAAATSALAALDEAAAGLDSRVGGLHVACGQLKAAGVTRAPTEQERLNEERGAYKGYLPVRDDQQLSLAHGLLTAPAVAVALAERDAQEAAGRPVSSARTCPPPIPQSALPRPGSCGVLARRRSWLGRTPRSWRCRRDGWAKASLGAWARPLASAADSWRISRSSGLALRCRGSGTTTSKAPVGRRLRPATRRHSSSGQWSP